MRIVVAALILTLGVFAKAEDPDALPELTLDGAEFSTITNAPGGDHLYLEYNSKVDVENRDAVIAELAPSLSFIQATAEKNGFKYVEIFVKKTDKAFGFLSYFKGVNLYLHQGDDGTWSYGGAKY